jgi:hypothetical protein
VLWAVTLIQSMTACMSDLHNKGRLNCVFELVGVLYGPRPMAGTDAFPEDSKKRKIDATGKTPVGKMPLKCVKAPGKKKAEPLKIVVSWTKSGSKTPSDVEVASTEPAKRVKKVVPNPAVAPTPVWATVGASGSRGATEGAKATSATQKHRVPASRMLAEASSTESLESSPHELLPRASPPEVVMRPERESSLHITSRIYVGGASISDVVAAITAGGWCIGPNTLEGRQGMSEDDKMLLDCLEHVSCARVCCLFYGT